MKKYLELKKKMMEHDVIQNDIAECLGTCASYVSKRMLGYQSFTMEDCYKICELLLIPVEKIHFYFPRNGIGTIPERKKRPIKFRQNA